MQASPAAAGPPSSTSQRHLWGAAFLWVWGAVTLVPVSLLMGSHLLTLPVPPVQAAQRLMSQDVPQAAPAWNAFHVLAQKCGCSVKVVEGLLARGPRVGFKERVLFMGDASAFKAALLAKGFELEVVTPDILKERYGIEGAPLLVVANPEGRVVYSGGYSDRKQGQLEDAVILDEALRGTPESRPLFGCAVSASLQRKLDPLRLKYSF